MKVAVTVICSALGASACCIGPVVFSLMGAGALSAASVRLEPYRPWFIAVTVIFVGAALYGAYRPALNEECKEGVCNTQSKRTLRTFVWIIAAIAAALIAFPYYIGWFV